MSEIAGGKLALHKLFDNEFFFKIQNIKDRTLGRLNIVSSCLMIYLSQTETTNIF